MTNTPHHAQEAQAKSGALPHGRIKDWHCLLFLALLVLGCYANSLQNSFHYDDIHSILENPSVQTLKAKHVWESNARTRFVSIYSFCLNYALSGFECLPAWHAVNVSVHLLIAFLIYGIVVNSRVRQYGRPLALLTAAIFAVHPLCTEPVNYIQARAAQFVLLFSLGAGFTLMRFANTRRWYWFAACLPLASARRLAPTTPLSYRQCVSCWSGERPDCA